jgi:hypothetical protein
LPTPEEAYARRAQFLADHPNEVKLPAEDRAALRLKSEGKGPKYPSERRYEGLKLRDVDLKEPIWQRPDMQEFYKDRTSAGLLPRQEGPLRPLFTPPAGSVLEPVKLPREELSYRQELERLPYINLEDQPKFSSNSVESSIKSEASDKKMTPEEYETWARANFKTKYVPENLLEYWGLDKELQQYLRKTLSFSENPAHPEANTGKATRKAGQAE